MSISWFFQSNNPLLHKYFAYWMNSTMQLSTFVCADRKLTKQTNWMQRCCCNLMTQSGMLTWNCLKIDPNELQKAAEMVICTIHVVLHMSVCVVSWILPDSFSCNSNDYRRIQLKGKQRGLIETGTKDKKRNMRNSLLIHCFHTS